MFIFAPRAVPALNLRDLSSSMLNTADTVTDIPGTTMFEAWAYVDDVGRYWKRGSYGEFFDTETVRIKPSNTTYTSSYGTDPHLYADIRTGRTVMVDATLFFSSAAGTAARVSWVNDAGAFDSAKSIRACLGGAVGVGGPGNAPMVCRFTPQVTAGFDYGVNTSGTAGYATRETLVVRVTSAMRLSLRAAGPTGNVVLHSGSRIIVTPID